MPAGRLRHDRLGATLFFFRHHVLACRGSILTEPRFAITLQLFYLADNGVTVLCPEAEVGDTGEVNGVLYTKRDRDGLFALRQTNSADLVTSCTSGVTDMSNLFNVRVPLSRLSCRIAVSSSPVL